MSAALLRLCVCLLSVEFLTLEKKSNLQDRMWLDNCGIASPTEHPRRSGRVYSRRGISEVSPAAIEAHLCLTALEMLSR